MQEIVNLCRKWLAANPDPWIELPWGRWCCYFCGEDVDDMPEHSPDCFYVNLIKLLKDLGDDS